ncbi:MAG: FAD-dependent oxidoreductase [Gammaproteobacteria bacterium]|nr:FAD-dependent oxidoreductase [Gammaproteobacteria bacterium]
MKEKSNDIIIIGAGIAGVSAGALLAEHANVRIIEMETQPGYHSSGRSAAFFSPPYGNSVVRAFTAASEQFFRDPPTGFSDVELIRPRDCLFIARPDQKGSLQDMHTEIPSLLKRTSTQIVDQVPILGVDNLAGGLLDISGGDLDVNEIMQGYLRKFRSHNGKIENATMVESLSRKDGLWRIDTGKQNWYSPIVINAAGAWADTIAAMAGLTGLDITPKRRTALLIDAPSGEDISDWPLCIDIDEQFYFKPDAGQLLISPADETPSAACDAQPEEMDIALAVDRFEQASGLEVNKINHKWAGLRSFAPDKTFVAGFDSRANGFFWLAGQGGYGVQTAPALAALSVTLLTDVKQSGPYQQILQFEEKVSPERLLS